MSIYRAKWLAIQGRQDVCQICEKTYLPQDLVDLSGCGDKVCWRVCLGCVPHARQSIAEAEAVRRSGGKPLG